MLYCIGRPVSRFDNNPTGPACFAIYPGALDSARVIGWRVGPVGEDGTRPAMCPSCGRPGADDENPGVAVLEPLPGL